MPTIKEQIDLIQQSQEKNEQLEKKLQDILTNHKDLINTSLKHNLSAVKTIDGYFIKITPQKRYTIKTTPQKQDSDDYSIYEIIIEEHFKTRDPLCYFKMIVKKEPKAVMFDDKLLNIRCTIQENNQRLDNRQIIDFITQTFGF